MTQLPSPAPGRFFSHRWHGQVPVRLLVWRDMLVIGTAINLLATFGALMLAAQGAGTGVAALVHFAPLPYNLFLFVSLLRSPQRSQALWVIGLLWLVMVTLV